MQFCDVRVISGGMRNFGKILLKWFFSWDKLKLKGGRYFGMESQL